MKTRFILLLLALLPALHCGGGTQQFSFRKLGAMGITLGDKAEGAVKLIRRYCVGDRKETKIADGKGTRFQALQCFNGGVTSMAVEYGKSARVFEIIMVPRDASRLNRFTQDLQALYGKAPEKTAEGFRAWKITEKTGRTSSEYSVVVEKTQLRWRAEAIRRADLGG